MTPSTVTLELGPVIEAICRRLARFAVPSRRLVRANRWNVEVHTGQGRNAGLARFQFYSKDDFGMTWTFDPAAFLANPAGYLTRMEAGIVEGLAAMRAQRQALTRAVLADPHLRSH